MPFPRSRGKKEAGPESKHPSDSTHTEGSRRAEGSALEATPRLVTGLQLEGCSPKEEADPIKESQQGLLGCP